MTPTGEFRIDMDSVSLFCGGGLWIHFSGKKDNGRYLYIRIELKLQSDADEG
jgi:hypothetical protein